MDSPRSPQFYGKLQLLQVQQPKISTQNTTSINSISGGSLHEEHVRENTSICIEKEKEEQETTLISPNKYGPGFTMMHK